MSFHLDTNTVIAIFKDRPPQVRRRLRRETDRGRDVAISSIVLSELWYGASKSGRWADNVKRIRDFLSSDVAVIAFNEDASQTAGEIRAALKKTGNLIGAYDVLIAAQAVRMGATLVTANVREFSRVPGLKWEDWSA